MKFFSNLGLTTKGDLRRSAFLLSIIVVLAILWIFVLINYFNLPLYLDSLFTIGAGAKLADQGHFSSTFMLYGLVNPYILEALIFFKLGALAPHVLRLIQFSIALTGIFFLARTVSYRKNSLSSRLSFFTTIAVVLSSTTILIESFEPTPENATLCIFSILLYLLTIYRPGKRHCFLIGLTLALLAGTRPTSIILALPVFLAIPQSFSKKSYARKYWRWVFLIVASFGALLTSFPQLVSIQEIVLFAFPLMFFVTLFSFLHDRGAGHSKVWKEFLLIIAYFVILLPVLFPNYFLHFQEFIRQTKQYHLEVEYPCNSISIIGKSIFYSIIYITIAFPGPFAATGFFTAIGLFISKRRKNECSGYRNLSLFVLGIVPFVLIVTRNENFQARYLIPLMGLFFIIASIGVKYILSTKLKYFLLIPFLVSSYQLSEIVQYKTNGGILNAFYDLSIEEPGTIQAQDIGPCNPHYYGDSKEIYYPLIPYIPANLHVFSPDNALYSISFNNPDSNYTVTKTYGSSQIERNSLVRASDFPSWTDLVYLTGRPWIWRGWSTVYFAISR